MSILAPATVSGQCDSGWLPTPGSVGFDGWVRTTASFDPDGPGPEPTQLIAGGTFAASGTEAVSCIARWDGNGWRAMGSGLTLTTDGNTLTDGVFCMAVYNGQLYVGGRFAAAGGIPTRGIARWDGANWHAVGAGVTGSNTVVYAMLVRDQQLYIGGAFTQVDTQPAASLARLGPSGWSTVGSGVSGGAVLALASHDGALYIGGTFTSAGGSPAASLARWNGATLRPALTSLTGSRIGAIASTPWGLAVGGQFTNIEGVAAQNIACLNAAGLWTPLAGGTGGNVDALCMLENRLFVGGLISESSSSDAYVNHWDGSSWQQTPSLRFNTSSAWVHTLTLHEGKLLVGGRFVTAGNITANNIAQWTGSDWTSVGSGFSAAVTRYEGTGGDIAGFTTYEDDLIAVGSFDTVGGIAARGVARWDGLKWSALGTGFSTAFNTSRYLGFCATVHNGDLIVGGYFTFADGQPVSRIARWNGQQWLPLGSGANDTVWDVVSYNGKLIAVGEFYQIGGVFAGGIAAWDGVSWEALTNWTGGSPMVYTATVYENELIVGGIFSTLGGVPVSDVGRWNGSVWRPMAGGLNTAPRSIRVCNGALYAGGGFTMADGQPVARIARWNGSTWLPVGGGADGSVLEMTDYQGDLIVSGNFNTIGGITSPMSARFRTATQQWEPIGDGTLLPNDAVHSYKGELMFGCLKHSTANRRTFWGRWTDTQTPWIARQPDHLTVSTGLDAVLSTSLASGYEPLSFQWRRNGLAVVNGMTPFGSAISGATTNELTITATHPADAGNYTCDITYECGNLTTSIATLTINSTCSTADFNNDGDSGTDADIEAFFACLAGNCCPTCWHLGADFNADGDSGTDADIEAFFRVLAGGNC